jgi:hypothetical protein
MGEMAPAGRNIVRTAGTPEIGDPAGSALSEVQRELQAEDIGLLLDRLTVLLPGTWKRGKRGRPERGRSPLPDTSAGRTASAEERYGSERGWEDASGRASR